MIKNLSVILLALFAIPTLASMKVGDSVEGEFEVMSNYGRPAISLDGIFIDLSLGRGASTLAAATLNYLNGRLAYRRPIESSVTVKGTLIRGRDVRNRETLLVAVTALETPDFALSRGKVIEVTDWEGALRFKDGRNWHPIIAANASDIPKIKADIEGLKAVAKSNGVYRTFVWVNDDARVSKSSADQLVLPVTSIDLATYSEARKAGFEPEVVLGYRPLESCEDMAGAN